MSQIYRKSFLVLLALIFLLPIFFVPGGALNLAVSKSIFLVFGVVLAVLVLLSEAWKEGKFVFFFHPITLLALLLPVIYLVSALSSTPSSLSLLGYNFEVGTFGYVLLGSLFMFLISTVFTDTSRILQAIVAFFGSILAVALLTSIKIASESDVLVFGSFFGNMGNPIGNWTDLAISFGLVSLLSALAIGVIPMKRSIKAFAYASFVLGTALLAIINFSIAFALTLGASVLLVLYFWNMEKQSSNQSSTTPLPKKNFFLRPAFLPMVLGVVSIIFLINPNVPGGSLDNVVANKFGVNNIDVRPSLSVTLGVSKAVLAQKGLLGSGPNTFERDWLIYKPVDINTTPFWATTFPFGVGFIPTQVVSTGAFGTIIWLAFFILLLVLGVKVLSRLPESRAERFTLVSTLFGTLFLWASSFLYAPSSAVLMFAFVFSGLFISASLVSGIVSSRTLNLKEPARNRFASILVMAVVSLGAIYLAWSGFEKGASAYYFKKAVDMESYVTKALAHAPNDIHYTALSRINFARAQDAVSATTGTPEENRATFERAVSTSIEAAKSAVSSNPESSQNWMSLGVIYSALVPAPFSTPGAYENAAVAYAEASKRNPLNPEIQLFLSQLELNKGDREAALSFARKAIALKDDYADAHLTLAQLEIQNGNVVGAIASAEKLATLVPNNPGIYFELGVLKYSNRDYLGAANALKMALASASDYANAQYYLGLSLTRLGQLDEALKQFEALAVTNPDNDLIESIIKELKAGKTTFLSSQ